MCEYHCMGELCELLMPSNCIIKSQKCTSQVQHFLVLNICVSIFKGLDWVETGRSNKFH